MRIRELPGWPPREFQCTEDVAMRYDAKTPDSLRLDAVTFIPGHPTAKTPGDLVLTLRDKDKTEMCTTRLKVQDADLARRAHAVLARCKGLTLAQAGQREIDGE